MSDQAQARPHLLLSYHYYKNRDIRGDLHRIYGDGLPSVFLDCGAFSAMTMGVEIDLDEYIQFVHDNRDLVSVYANLDVIGDWKATAEHQRIMEEAGLAPLAVYHQSDPFHVLPPMAEKYDYIALGGMVGKPRPLLKRYLLKVWDHMRTESYPCHVHGFGITSWELMRAFPWTSVDSSTWTQGLRWGVVTLFDRGKFVKINLRDLKAAYDNSKVLRAYGISPNDLALEEQYCRPTVAALGAMAWMRAEDWMNEQRKDPRFEGPSDTMSVHLTKQCYNPDHDGGIMAARQFNLYLATWTFDKAQMISLSEIQKGLLLEVPKRISQRKDASDARGSYDPDDPRKVRADRVPKPRRTPRSRRQSTRTRRGGDKEVDSGDGVLATPDRGSERKDRGRPRSQESAVRAAKRRLRTGWQRSARDTRRLLRKGGIGPPSGTE